MAEPTPRVHDSRMRRPGKGRGPTGVRAYAGFLDLDLRIRWRATAAAQADRGATPVLQPGKTDDLSLPRLTSHPFPQPCTALDRLGMLGENLVEKVCCQTIWNASEAWGAGAPTKSSSLLVSLGVTVPTRLLDLGNTHTHLPWHATITPIRASIHLIRFSLMNGGIIRIFCGALSSKLAIGDQIEVAPNRTRFVDTVEKLSERLANHIRRANLGQTSGIMARISIRPSPQLISRGYDKNGNCVYVSSQML
ncbi:hypothetical protein CC1G_15119 [Coprinopsis cinerea okayama7|uniref:Uncharacterized protein n=1 Tax=Coprinopsis cinerea (strain Okayama-7 / 130 / ATCC MYA-4618 / FGSC 9003) TaxID=240176 RepID=D6RPL0_COPC7|nr:hypothetical protein CC1G_15119 [Coprinopsis cinerea okayama7\|eukprot:XP_002910479.1 hypothetical protein CC1G_15119 [Coprinopsis cinerea okayama7\